MLIRDPMLPRIVTRPASRTWRLCVAVLAAIVASVIVSDPSWAGGIQRRGQQQIEAALVGVAALSAPQMADQTGAGLSVATPKPSLGQTPPPRVTLWDELQQPTNLSMGGGQSLSVTVHIAQ